MRKSLFTQWRASFFTGLAVVLPGVITLAVVKWFFGTVSSLTDLLLFFLPKSTTHEDAGTGPIFWYWSLLALTLAVLALAVWCFCRFYYFAFYVIEHYVDPGYRFSGLGSFVGYLLSKRRRGGPTA